MSSFIIGLDISGDHTTAVLVRIEQSSKQILSIERDTFYTHSLLNIRRTDPRAIISTWIRCIDDILHDFVQNYKKDETIVGIACSILGAMDYDRGVYYSRISQSNSCEKVFGLDLRLLLQDGLRDLVSRWKQQFHAKYLTPANSSWSSLLYPKTQTVLENLQLTRKLSITLRSLPSSSSTLTIASTTNGEIQQPSLASKKLTEYCGVHDTRSRYKRATDSSHEGHSENIPIIPPKKVLTTDHFSPKLWTMFEQLPKVPISFYNDTTCFAVGEAHNLYNQNYKRILALTLGTDFGSTFLDRGEIISNHADVPAARMLDNCPFDEISTADEWFSTSGLMNIYNKLLRQESLDDEDSLIHKTSSSFSTRYQSSVFDGCSLAERAGSGDKNAIKAFEIFARLLGKFLIRYIQGFQPDLIVIGGGIAHAWYLLENELNLAIKQSCPTEVYFSLSSEKSICLGAVRQQLSKLSSLKSTILRETYQNLLPVMKTIDTSAYDLYPCHEIPIGYIGIGFKQLNEKLFRLIEENQILLIDGFVGTYFDQFASELNEYYYEQTKKKNVPSLVFYDTRAFLQAKTNNPHPTPPHSICRKPAIDLDFRRDLIDFKKLNYLQKNLSYPCVVIGPGASFVNEISPLIYIDLTKNELYYRTAAQTSSSYFKSVPSNQEVNFSGFIANELKSVMYERQCLHFFDFPVFNKLKQELLPRMNFFVDGQRPNCPTWLDGDTFRQALAHLVNQPIRVRPWFESDSWGGQWLKSVCSNLSQYPENYACSFEMTNSENGLLLSDVNRHLVELSWDLFYGSQTDRILGNDLHHRLFSGSNDFPIRLNLLDTINGEQLLPQCRLNVQCGQVNFAEQGAYYVVDTKQHWTDEEQCNSDSSSLSYIYLGFHGHVKPEEFYQTLCSSYENRDDLDVNKCVQSMSSTIHDFFLIPNETMHATGPNQVLLAISSTPYIHRSKIYNHLREDLDGDHQPLNVEHTMRHSTFDRRAEQFRCQPIRFEYEEGKYEIQHLPTHDVHLYDVHRILIEPDASVEITRSTENRFHLCMLVAGDAIEVQYNSVDHDQDKQIRQYNYIETFLIPASISEYRLRPIIRQDEKKRNYSQFILLIIFLKWDCRK